MANRQMNSYTVGRSGSITFYRELRHVCGFTKFNSSDQTHHCTAQTFFKICTQIWKNYPDEESHRGLEDKILADFTNNWHTSQKFLLIKQNSDELIPHSKTAVSKQS